MVTDGWSGYNRIEGYKHEVHVQSRKKQKTDAEEDLLPRVHLVISLLKRWLMGTHQGGVQDKHMDDYLNEFTFRFNHRTSGSRGLLFYRLVEQAVKIEPSTYSGTGRPQRVGVSGVKCIPRNEIPFTSPSIDPLFVSDIRWKTSRP